MGWGISKNASSKEKLKANINDELQGLNSCGELSYSTYSLLFDLLMELCDQIYELGENEELDKSYQLIQKTKDLLKEKTIDEYLEEESTIELNKTVQLNLKKLYQLGSLENKK